MPVPFSNPTPASSSKLVLSKAMGKQTSAKSEQKKLQRQQEAQRALALQNTLKAANEDINLLAPLQAFTTFQRNGLQLQLTAHTADTLPQGVLMWAFQLVQDNMQAIYAADNFPFKPKAKLQELSDSASRYILAWQGTQQMAFVAFRFEAEEGEPVLYVYEVQLETAAQRKGLGRFMMQLAELLAARHGMAKVMLTVQHSNTAARHMYQRLGYTLDPTSPNACDPEAEERYDILCKPCKRKTTPALQQSVDNGQSQ